jgi:hypothetical protein
MAKRFLISSLFIATGLCQNISVQTANGSLVAPKGAKILTVGVLGGKLDAHDKPATYN